MSSLWNPPWWQLTSCAKDVHARSKMAVPIRPSRKHCFFIKITISQYHDIDISYIDIDIAKNVFSMTSLDATRFFSPLLHPLNHNIFHSPHSSHQTCPPTDTAIYIQAWFTDLICIIMSSPLFLIALIFEFISCYWHIYYFNIGTGNIGQLINIV